MLLADPALETAQFLAFARKAMGDIDSDGTLAQAFAFEAGKNSKGGAYPNFWQVGCVFDSILDYFLALKEAGALDDADRKLMAQLLPLAASGYQYGIIGKMAAWYDDWAWWGIAAAKAFDAGYEEIFGEQLAFFQMAAVDLWGLISVGNFAAVANRIPDAIWIDSALQSDGVKFTREILTDRGAIHAGTRNAWSLIGRGANGKGTPRQNADYAHFTTPDEGSWAVPRHMGGCWQYDLSTMAFPCDDGPDWQTPDPAWQGLGVFQVTLMSGLYLSFCCSLIVAAERKAAEKLSGGAWDLLHEAAGYRQAAAEVVDFLTAWLETPHPDSLATTFPEGALVHERMPTYAAFPGTSNYPALEGYHADAYWGGDQGLIMGALKQYAALGGVVSPTVTSYPPALLKGVFYNISATAWQQSGAVGPYLDPNGTSPISNDDNDYSSGSGIFWRYVMRSCRLDPDFGLPAREDPRIVDIATTSGTTLNDWGNALFQPFNTVAAAIGAWYLLK